MQAINVVIHIIVNNEVKYAIAPPCYPAGQAWDIGFINALNGEMMIINAFAKALPDARLELCNEYFGFYGYLSKKTNLASLLGTAST